MNSLFSYRSADGRDITCVTGEIVISLSWTRLKPVQTVIDRAGLHALQTGIFNLQNLNTSFEMQAVISRFVLSSGDVLCWGLLYLHTVFAQSFIHWLCSCLCDSRGHSEVTAATRPLCFNFSDYASPLDCPPGTSAQKSSIYHMTLYSASVI